MSLKDEIYQNIHGDLTSIDDKLAAEHIHDCPMCSRLIESITNLIARHFHDEIS